MNIEKLLEAGVHFGHRVTKWNPRMAPFIYGERKGIHILDVIQTMTFLEETSQFLEKFKNEPKLVNEGNSRNFTKSPFPGRKKTSERDSARSAQQSADPTSMAAEVSKGLVPRSRKKDVLFVGTKKQASPLIENAANTINGYPSTNKTFAELLSTSVTGGTEATEVNSLADVDNESATAIAKDPQRPASKAFEASFPSMQFGESKNTKIVAHYVNHRWLGGLLTNWSTMKICIQQLNDLEKRNAAGEFENLPKKERSNLKKDYEKLMKFFGGIKNLKDIPDLVFIIGQDSEMNAVRECLKLQKMNPQQSTKSMKSGANTVGSPSMPRNLDSKSGQQATKLPPSGNSLRTITLLDTNCDPELADLFIPANDDSAKSLTLLLDQFTKVLSD